MPTPVGGVRVDQWEFVASRIASSFTDQERMKSRLGSSLPLANSTARRDAVPPPLRSRIGCISLPIDVIGMPPVSTETAMERSCPARVPGGTGIGVMRSASGTTVVGSENGAPGRARGRQNQRPFTQPVPSSKIMQRSRLPLP